MAEITKKNLVLSFNTPAGATLKMTINTPNESLTSEEISKAMDAIVDARAFGEEQVVATKEEAKYVIQEVETIAL